MLSGMLTIISAAEIRRKAHKLSRRFGNTVGNPLPKALMALKLSLLGQHRLLGSEGEGHRRVRIAGRGTERTAISKPARRLGGSSPRHSRRVVAFGGDGTSRAESILVFVEQSQRTMRSLYLKALPGPLAWTPSFLVPFATGISIYGAANGHRLLQYLHGLQAPDWFPMAHTLGTLYTEQPGICDIAFDTLLSTTCALFMFVGAPAMDLILGADPKTPDQAKGPDGIYKAVLYAHVILHWLLLLSACTTAGSSELHPLTLLGLTVSLACEGAIIFTVAHELLHSAAPADKRMASLGLMPLAYMHWVPSHIAHHCKVGLEEDPTTARLGEPLYTFVARSVVGNVRDGVQAELRRLSSRRLPLVCLQNRVFHWAACPLVLLAGVYSLCGSTAAALGIGQALMSILFLEEVNYIEHYGLRRQRLPTGKVERVSVYHSWNANWLFTNSLIFSLQRHSDHHANAHKPYQRLEDVEGAPQLPASYPVMVLLALLPGLFFDVMDPLALQVARSQIQRDSRQRLD